jgi:hypothetical protein
MGRMQGTETVWYIDFIVWKLHELAIAWYETAWYRDYIV